MKPLRYLDFELKIEREKDRYAARVLRSPAGEASCDFTLPFSEDKLELLVLKLGRPRSSTRRIHTSEMEAARDLGGKLFEVVFGGDVRACLRSSLDEVYRKGGTGLRLKLRLQEVPLLSDLPWEFLLDDSLDRFFAQSNQTPIVRYIEMPERIKPITVNLPLHLLVVISSPADYPRLDIERERTRLQKALDSLSKAGKVHVKWLEKPTLTDLLHCLQRGEYHIFHFIGHGGFDKKREEGVLVLEDEQGRGWLADAHRIGIILHDHPSLRLAVLNSCESARNSLTDPFAGVATGLIRQGVPAVVAMQFEITDEAAITFAGEFYAALAQGFPVDAAVAEARKAIYILPNDIEWGTPVLWMRSSDGILFDLTQKSELVQKPVSEEPLPPAPEPVVAPEPETAPKAKQPKTTVVTPSKLQVAPTMRILRGHKESVQSVAFSPNGKILASGAAGALIWRDYTVRLWRVSDGKLMRTLEGYKASVQSVTFSPNGKMLASGSYGDRVRLWCVSDGKLMRKLGRYGDSANSVAFSPDGKTLASGSADMTVRLWRVSDGKLMRTFGGRISAVISVAFLPDGKTLVSGSSDKTVRLWSVSDGKLMRILKGHTEGVQSVAFSPNGKMLASASSDGSVRLWSVSDGKLMCILKRRMKLVYSVAFSPDGVMLASSTYGGSVLLWNVSDGKFLHTLKGPTSPVTCVAFSPDGTALASGSFDTTVRLWELK
jgi:WD40 repeat protein